MMPSGKTKSMGAKVELADRQIVENILVHEIRDVADDGLRMHVVRGRIFGRRTFEIERERFTLF